MLTIHGVPISVHTRKVIISAMLKGIPYAIEPVIPFTPPPGWRELSPTGLIPVISDGDYALADSAAICAYLERKHPEPALVPAEPRELGRALFLEAYAGGTLFRTVIHGLFVQKVIRPGILGEPTDQGAIDRILGEVLPQVFGYLDGACEGAYLVADRLTLADIALASNLINFHYLGFRVDADAYPRLARYAAAMIAREPFRKALEAEAPFAEKMGLDRSFIAA